MKTSVTKPSVGTVLFAALTGAAVAGTLIVAFTLGWQHAPVALFFRGIARIAFGPQMLGQPNAPVIGGLIHFAVSFGWALGYAIMALRTPALVRGLKVNGMNLSPLISGICFGIVVELAMDGVLVMINAFTLPTPSQFMRDLLAHTIGFGVPLAYTIAAILPVHPEIAAARQHAS